MPDTPAAPLGGPPARRAAPHLAKTRPALPAAPRPPPPGGQHHNSQDATLAISPRYTQPRPRTAKRQAKASARRRRPARPRPGAARSTVPLQHGGTYLRTTRPYTQPATGRSTRGVPGQCAPAATQTLERAPFRRACAPTAPGLRVQRCHCSGSYPARACAGR